MVISSHAALNTRRLQRIIITLLVVLGTVVSLLLAHSLENTHPSETTGSSSASSIVVLPASNAPAVNDDAVAGVLSLCAALAFACGIAFLVVFVRRTRQSPLVTVRAACEQLTEIITRRASQPRTLSLTVLCISRT